VQNIIPVRLVPIPDLPTGIDTDFVRASPQSFPQPQLVSNATQAIFQAPNTGVKTGFSNLPQFGADRVQATGNLGRGIKIGIIDTGVDYTREPLGGCFGPNCKIVGGYDFAGDNYNGQNQPVEDADPLDKCSGHGTIVAGLIGANNNEFGVPGVAPEASLYAYRTYGCTGTSGEDVIFKAMQRAYVDGVDVLNLSLGTSFAQEVANGRRNLQLD
jgi:subtilisin family serine protease